MKSSIRAISVVMLFTSSMIHAQEVQPSLSLKVTSDFLALHVSGIAPAGTTALQLRLGNKEAIHEAAPWIPGNSRLGDDGSFAFDVPLESPRWIELHVRALKGDDVITTKEAHRKLPTFERLTPERIAALPEAERAAWSSYLKQSSARFEQQYLTLATECRKLGLAQSKPAPSDRAELELKSDTPEAWFSSAEAQKQADVVISYQTPDGGWSKSVDFQQGPRQLGMHWTTQSGDGWHYCGTIDNRSTTEQIKLLAGVFTATQRDDAKRAASRGIEWLLEAQYPNGGWPQNYPVESGYHEAITLNDNAMLHVLEVLLTIAQAKAPFTFVEEPLRQRAQSAFDKGIACLIAAQVKVNDQLTVWCAQHDPLTLEPVAARKKEPPSLSGGESAELLKFFMRKCPISPAITASIQPALSWLDGHRITNLRKAKNAAGKTDYVVDEHSTEVYWARFYDVKTAKPMFAGSQDGIVYDTFGEMAAKNRVGYDYYTTKPRDVIEKEAARWKSRLAKGK